MQVADSVLIKVLLFDQAKIGVALHLRHRLLTSDELLRGAIVELTLVDGSILAHVAHLAHVVVVDALWRHHHVLLLWQLLLAHFLLVPLSELAEGVLLGLHVTVVGEVWIIGAALVLERLDRRGKVNLALEELLGADFIEFVGRVAIGWHGVAWVV